MSQRRREKNDVLGLVNLGLILILVSVLLLTVFGTGANLVLAWSTFLSDFTIQEIFPGFSFFNLQHPEMHGVLYTFIYWFFLGTVIISVIILILRVIFKDTYRRQVESAGGIVWSAGMAWTAYLLMTLAISFPTFVGYLIVFGGLSLITSSLAYFAMRRYGP
jgi:ABC-type Mn2+/Zn2+ transport system permease subunit